MRVLGILSLLVAPTLLALPGADPRPLLPPDVGPAAYGQQVPDVASDGHGFVAVWWDTRMAEHPNFVERSAIFATRVDANGNSLDPFGIEISDDASGPQIASNGQGYMVAYASGFGVQLVHLDADARPDSARKQIFDGAALTDLSSNGSSYCALAGRQEGSTAVILAGDGTILRTLAVEGWAETVVAASDGSYVVISMRRDCAAAPCVENVLATTIAPDGTLNSRPVGSPDGRVERLDAVSSGSRVLVSWLAVSTEQVVIEYQLIEPDGSPVGTSHRVHQAESNPSIDNPIPSAAWDGRSFLLVWQAFSDEVGIVGRALRIDGEGTPRDEEPLDLGVGAASFKAATNGSAVLLVSSETVNSGPDIFARALASFDTLPDLPAPSLIAFSPTTESEPALATGGTVAITVSREGDSYGAIGATIFTPQIAGGEVNARLAPAGQYVVRDGPSAGVAGDLFLAAWRERGDSSTRILAKRVTANGAVLDSQPIVVADEPVSYANFADTAIASDGTAFLVVWHGPDDEIRARQVGRDGKTIGGAVLVSRHPAGQVRERRTPAAVWTGTAYLVVWNELIVPDGNVSATNPTYVVYRAARMTSDGTLLDTADSASLYELPGGCQGLALARGLDGVYLTTATGSYYGTPWSIDVMALDADGNPLLSTPLRLVESAYPHRLMNPAAAWNGRSLLVFWSDRAGDSVIRGAEIDPHLTRFSLFDVSTRTSYFPTAATIEGGALLVNTEIASEQADVARLFARTFTLAEPPRRRGVRH